MKSTIFKKIAQLALLNFIFLLSGVLYLYIFDSRNRETVADTFSFLTLTENGQVVLGDQQIPELPKQSGKAVESEKPSAKPKTPFDELVAHNSKSDCWILYAGHIYDITTYLGTHPGGDALLLKYCGKDATAAFNSKEKSPPKEHSVNAHEMLKGYLVI